MVFRSIVAEGGIRRAASTMPVAACFVALSRVGLTVRFVNRHFVDDAPPRSAS